MRAVPRRDRIFESEAHGQLHRANLHSRLCVSHAVGGGRPPARSSSTRNRQPVVASSATSNCSPANRARNRRTPTRSAGLTRARLPSAESEHASGGVLAAPLPTIGPKRKSAALSAGFSNVAIPALSHRWLVSPGCGTRGLGTSTLSKRAKEGYGAGSCSCSSRIRVFDQRESECPGECHRTCCTVAQLRRSWRNTQRMCPTCWIDQQAKKGVGPKCTGPRSSRPETKGRGGRTAGYVRVLRCLGV